MNGEKRERKRRLRSQTTWVKADRPAERADDSSGNMEDIGGEVCPGGGVTFTAAEECECEVCAMMA